MISNEQRAHDLAILMVQIKFSEPSLPDLYKELDGRPLDVADLYLKMYELAIAAINKRFGN